MGYAENCLPKALAALGHDVHLVTSNVQPYFNSPGYKETYEPFIGSGVQPCGLEQFDGYTLHRLPYARWRGRLRIEGLLGTLRSLRPAVVQTFDCISPSTIEAAVGSIMMGYKLFLESHVHASVFHPPLSRFDKSAIYTKIIGKFTGAASKRCYPISVDAMRIAAQFFGVPEKKMEVCSLGVDTQHFQPTGDQSGGGRKQLREQLGFSDSDLVCVYTGRFAPGKGPELLAEAVAKLVDQGVPVRGLFVGGGTAEQQNGIRAHNGSVVHPFVPFQDLPPFYWASDIGIWPRQESTSQLDAAACGLPIIISNRTQTPERINGNGLAYKEGDAEDLARQILALRDPQVRGEMGRCGARRMKEEFSWLRIADQRRRDYEKAGAGQ